jgi:hypothetical protein
MTLSKKQNEPPSRTAQFFRQVVGGDVLRLCLSPAPLAGQQADGTDAEQGYLIVSLDAY